MFIGKYRILFDLFWTFFKVGLFTFGGGLAMLPLIQDEVVNKNKWLTEEEILEVFALSQSIPGVIAVNTSIFTGNKLAGKKGSVAAALGTILPAFLSIILILTLLNRFRDNKYVEKAFAGIRAASAALILLAAIKLAKSSLKNKKGYIIALASFFMIIVLNISAAWAIISGGIAEYLIYLYERRKNKCQ